MNIFYVDRIPRHFLLPSHLVLVEVARIGADMCGMACCIQRKALVLVNPIIDTEVVTRGDQDSAWLIDCVLTLMLYLG